MAVAATSLSITPAAKEAVSTRWFLKQATYLANFLFGFDSLLNHRRIWLNPSLTCNHYTNEQRLYS